MIVFVVIVVCFFFLGGVIFFGKIFGKVLSTFVKQLCLLNPKLMEKINHSTEKKVCLIPVWNSRTGECSQSRIGECFPRMGWKWLLEATSKPSCWSSKSLSARSCIWDMTIPYNNPPSKEVVVWELVFSLKKQVIEQEKMATSCARGDLGWVLGKKY